MLGRLRHLFRREPAVPQVGPQGEEYEALEMERRWQEERDRYGENLIKKVGHKNLPFLDDPYN